MGRLVGGLVIGLGVGLVTGLESDGLNEVPPAAVIRFDVQIWLAAGLVVGLLGSTVVVGSPGFVARFLIYALAGLAAGLACGLGALWMRYAVGLVIAAAQGDLPVRLVRFLDWCAQEGILRRSGPAYQFRHLSLRNHLRRQAAVEILTKPDR